MFPMFFYIMQFYTCDWVCVFMHLVLINGFKASGL